MADVERKLRQVVNYSTGNHNPGFRVPSIGIFLAFAGVLPANSVEATPLQVFSPANKVK